MSVCCVTTRKLDNFDMTVQIKCNEVTLHIALLIMTHKGIRLEGTWTPITEIIQCGIEPTKSRTQQRPEHQHSQHPDTEIEEWMHVTTHDRRFSLDLPCARTRRLRHTRPGYHQRAPVARLGMHGWIRLSLIGIQRVAVIPHHNMV